MTTIVRILPTPTATERSGINTKTGSGGGLPHAVKMAENVKMKESQRFPIPTARDYRSGKGARPRGHSQQLPEVLGGTLNPPWVEWLMGFPDGWTDLDA